MKLCDREFNAVDKYCVFGRGGISFCRRVLLLLSLLLLLQVWHFPFPESQSMFIPHYCVCACVCASSVFTEFYHFTFRLFEMFIFYYFCLQLQVKFHYCWVCMSVTLQQCRVELEMWAIKWYCFDHQTVLNQETSSVIKSLIFSTKTSCSNVTDCCNTITCSSEDQVMEGRSCITMAVYLQLISCVVLRRWFSFWSFCSLFLPCVVLSCCQ